VDPSGFEDLVYEYLDGRASPEAVQKLNAALKREPTLARLFVDIAGADMLLSERYAAADQVPAGGPRLPSRRAARVRPRRRPFLPWAAWATAAAVMLAVFAWSLRQGGEGDGRTEIPREIARDEGSPHTSEGPPREIESDEPATAPAHERRPEIEVALEPEIPLTPDESPAPEEPELVVAPERPEPAPEPEVETERSVGRLGELAGMVKCRRAGQPRWFDATDGLPVLPGDEIDSRATVVSFVYRGGSKVVLNKSTWVSVGADSVVMLGKSGEVYCEVAGAAKGKFAVSTPQATVTDLGTRFGVDVSVRGTLVIVAEGSVEAKNDRGAVIVGENEQSRTASAKVAPGKPRPVNAAKAMAWGTREVLRVVFADDFGRSLVGAWPAGWEKHATEASTRSGFAVVAEPGAPGSRFIGAVNGGGTQHAFIPVAKWPPSFQVTFRARAKAAGVSRMGIEFEDGPRRPSFEYDDTASILRVDWPRGTAIKRAPLNLQPGTWHRWVVSVTGKRYSVEIDGKPLMEIELDDFGPVTRASLVSRGAGRAQYDDVRVLAPATK